MDLPDCPPGTEGYEDTVVEMARKPDDSTCTKAEQEFQDHIASLKIHVEDGSTRCMVERRGRDISGKWTYLCYPCAAVCSGEGVLQTHISGKKHKSKLGQNNPWPVSIFQQHPFILAEKGEVPFKTEVPSEVTGAVLQKVAEEVELYNKKPSELNLKYNKYREATCHLQDTLDEVKTPLLGLEYLIEHPPEEPHHEPAYLCSLCSKHGHPRTIINHLTCFWHRFNYVMRHFPKACSALGPYRTLPKYREGVGLVMTRLVQRIEDKYGRLRPVNIDKDQYEKEKDQIHQWLSKSFHFAEKPGATFEEVVDIDLITSLSNDAEPRMYSGGNRKDFEVRKRDPSPPVVAAPTKPRTFTARARRPSPGALSDVSLEELLTDERRPPPADRGHSSSQRYEPYPQKQNSNPNNSYRSWYDRKKNPDKRTDNEHHREMEKRSYKIKLTMELQAKIETSSKKMLSYHEKNPEKHPLYPEEWKKFWNRRYKEIQAEGKDPSKHDFKPEWIVYWTARMKQLHEEEVKMHVNELYRKMCLTPPGERRRASRSPETRRRTPEPRRRSPEPRRRSPEPRRRSPEPRRRLPDPRRRSPDSRRRSPDPHRQPSPPRRRSPERRRLPDHRPNSIDYRRDHKSPPRAPERRHEPARSVNTRSRSPVRPRRSPARTHIALDSARSRSPLSERAGAPPRNRSPAPPPSLQTVLVSDDELRPDEELSPWNSERSLESLGSLPDARSPPRSRTASEASRRPYSRSCLPQDLGPPENIVATLRLLVALEDYLGSIGPKIVDLLTEALKMEKELANSSEELLVRDSAVVLIETAKEKLKGAVQAGLVPAGAAGAVRGAVVRAAATLHAADTKTKSQQKEQASKKTTAMPVAGVGDVDRAQIAQQMAAALIAQGKTDVSSEELAQLVDAVVGMAEAKKREAAEKSRAGERVAERPQPAPASGTATALQMLQSAYDENDKRIENDAPDAMDGLSDSDLETLLKNFNELSAEEQHSLIAYLKKLEARSPQRVERLRQYVSAAAVCAPAAPPGPALAPVTIDSDDDDDYTVEEVFKSATEKVKENQILQEMEIVKKSLEESKTAPTPVVEDTLKPSLKIAPTIDLTANISSATDLLALVQASIQSTAKVTPTSFETVDVVASANQPRSFGDRSEAVNSQPPRPLLATHSNIPQQFGNQQGLLLPPPNFQNSYDNDTWSNQTQGNLQDNRSFMPGNRGSMQDNKPMQGMQDIRGPMLGGMQANRGLMQGGMQDNRGPMQGGMQDNRGPMQGGMQDNRGPMQGGMQDNRGPMQGSMQDNRGPMQGGMQDNRGPMQGGMQDNRGPMQGGMQDNRGPMQGGMQDNRGPMQGGTQDNRGPMQGGMQDNRGPMQGGMQDNRGPMQDNRHMQGGMQDNGYQQGTDRNRSFMPDNRGQNRHPLLTGPSPVRPQGNYGPDPYNQGPRGNFMNGRMQDNYDTRPMDMNQQNNFRGRGRGHYAGHKRGRGRGYY